MRPSEARNRDTSMERALHATEVCHAITATRSTASSILPLSEREHIAALCSTWRAGNATEQCHSDRPCMSAVSVHYDSKAVKTLQEMPVCWEGRARHAGSMLASFRCLLVCIVVARTRSNGVLWTRAKTHGRSSWAPSSWIGLFGRTHGGVAMHALSLPTIRQTRRGRCRRDTTRFGNRAEMDERTDLPVMLRCPRPIALIQLPYFYSVKRKFVATSASTRARDSGTYRWSKLHVAR